VDAVLADNAAALARVPECLHREVYHAPRPKSVHDASELGQGLIEISLMLRLSAIRAARAGSTEAAFRDILLVAHLGRLVESDPELTLLSAMIAAGQKGGAVTALGVVLRHVAPSRERARDLATELAALTTPPAAWRAVWASEYRMRRQSYTETAHAAAHEPPPPLFDGKSRWPNPLALLPASYTFKLNDSLALAAEESRAYQAEAGVPCRALARRDARSRSAGLQILLPDGIGRVLHEIGAPNFGKFVLRRCQADTRLAAAGAWLALRAYEHERGKLPASLAELVPERLAVLPIDAYDGQPLRYDAAQRLVYSVGEPSVADDPSLDPRFPIPSATAAPEGGAPAPQDARNAATSERVVRR